MRIPPWGLLLVFLFGVFLGWKTNGWRLESAINGAKATQVTSTVTHERKATASAHKADAAPAAAQQAQQQQVRVITKEIIRYVQTPAAAQPMPAEWVQIHDAAATGMPADPTASGLSSAQASEAAAPVALGEALGGIASNYDICNQEMNRLAGWQAWWNSVKPSP